MKNDHQPFLGTVAVGSAALTIGSRLAGCNLDNDFEDAFHNDDEPMLWGAAGHTPHDKRLLDNQFAVEIQGVYARVPGVLAVGGGKLNISVHDTTRDRPEHKTYTYGSHSYENLELTVEQGPGTYKLRAWARQAMGSRNRASSLRRTISVHCLARDERTILKTINYYGCFPVDLRAEEHSTASEVRSITITCNISRVEVA